MDKNTKLFSICIPTWNRAELLSELLALLCIQIKSSNLEKKVEIIISNNGSEDNTESIVKEYQKKFDFIIYHDNGINKGARYNLLKSLELSTSKYLTFLGDDDRYKENGIKVIVEQLESNKAIGSMFDSHLFKRNNFGNDARLSLNELLENFYYYIGNAGLFIIKTSYVKEMLNNYPYDFFNGSWPQTQLIVMGADSHIDDHIIIKDLDIFSQSLHDEVMIYSSYYLWRTTYFDLLVSILQIKKEINIKTYKAARNYLRNNLNQIFFNVLQCGVFIDDKKARHKTGKDIINNLNLFSFNEIILLIIASITLFLPTFITRPISNNFIYLTKGKTGITKKNNFVKKEMEKRFKKQSSSTKEVREFDFVNK